MTLTPTPTPTLAARQLWGFPSEDPTPDPTTLPPTECTPFILPSGGFVSINSAYTVYLTADGIFLPACTSTCDSAVNGSYACVQDAREPFFASSTPLIYVVATATVIAWTLLIVLLITPRTFSVFSRNHATALVPGRSVIGALSGRSSMFATGSRPWLQKAAALSVAISLTVATADTFKVAERQYANAIQSADNLRQEVTDSTEVRVLRVVSDLFLWLAQVQTLIRLFPRHKEKLLIKWVGFLLILCDIIFSCLNSFWIGADISDPANYTDAISALSYLFQLSLSLLYATWVFYYAVTKRRYAFYHDKMPNICIIALLSCVSVSIPVAFFIADILEPGIAGWGDYFRWVGAAAASILVWEWVERIEAIERDEKKDGILGREVFDGDEMLDNTPSDSHGHRRRSVRSRTSSSDPSTRTGVLPRFRKFMQLSSRIRPRDEKYTDTSQDGDVPVPQTNGQTRLHSHVVDVGRPADVEKATNEHFEPPPLIRTPIDRSNAASAESTVYTVRYHSVADTPPVPTNHAITAAAVSHNDSAATATATGSQNHQASTSRGRSLQSPDEDSTNQPRRRTRPNDPSLSSRQRSSLNSASYGRRQPFGRLGHFAVSTFRRSRKSPPLEVKNALSLDEVAAQDAPLSAAALSSSIAPAHERQRNGLMARFAVVGSGDTSRRTSIAAGREHGQPTVIPAPPRGQTWSPDEARHSPMDTIASSGTPGPALAENLADPNGSQVHLPTVSGALLPVSGNVDANGTNLAAHSSTTDVQHFPTNASLPIARVLGADPLAQPSPSPGPSAPSRSPGGGPSRLSR